MRLLRPYCDAGSPESQNGGLGHDTTREITNSPP